MQLPLRLLRRKVNVHKGDFGHIFILAGSACFSGAAVLSAEAAMRSGAGLVTLGLPASLNNAVIKIKPKEVMTLPLPETKTHSLSISAFQKINSFAKRTDVLLIGPGLSQDRSTQQLVRRVIVSRIRPMVIDADGLNALVGHLKLLLRTTSNALRPILTPHPGEMARLLGVAVKEVQADRQRIAKGFARNYHCTLLLKGHRTVVADASGRLYLNKTGNPGMATAGSGDVLSGVIAAFLGQGLKSFAAAKYAVYLHGLAGDLAAQEKTVISLIASDIIAKIPEAIRRCS